MRRLGAIALAVPVAVLLLTVEAPLVAGQAGPSCASHISLTRPPASIRVLRVRTGRITVVPFRRYVVTVMGKEWPSYLPQAVIEAGAVAVKQYAWYHMAYSSRSASGRCFDVKDGTGDQLYKPQRARIRPDHYRAVSATWSVSLRRDGQFFMTGYRRGDRVRCGHDATSWKLYARSATDCARRGKGWREILRTYYGPHLSFVGSGGSSASSMLPPTTSAVAHSPRPLPTSGNPSPPPNSPPTEVPAEAPAEGVAGGVTGGVAAVLEQESQPVL